MMPKHEYVILNSSRWESKTIVEWITYHKSIGFDHIYIYCNDDDPSDMIEAVNPFIMGDHPFVTLRHFPYQGQQYYMYIHFLENYKDECEWFMFVDSDEFLALKSASNIKEFMRSRRDICDCVYFNWIWFGPQSFKTRPEGSTLRQFTLRENEEFQMNSFAKTLTRSSKIDPALISRPPEPMFHHNWPPAIGDGLRKINVLNEDMDGYYDNFPHCADAYLSDRVKRSQIIATACIYHYLFRSREDFVRRFNRGTLGTFYFQTTWKDLHASNDLEDFISRLNQVEDLFLYRKSQEAISGIRDQIAIVKQPVYENLALKSCPTQSSTSQWSNSQNVDLDARGAISGFHTGFNGFHTELEAFPWWSTDLGDLYNIAEIRIYNPLANAELSSRAYPINVSVSSTGHEWQLVFKNANRKAFGGVDGHPLIIQLADKNIEARFVKLSLDSTDYLHLDEIEIYGYRQ